MKRAAPSGGPGWLRCRVQQKLMRHAQVSTTMRYGNAYMTEKRKAYEPWLQMVFPAEVRKKRKRATPAWSGLRIPHQVLRR